MHIASHLATTAELVCWVNTLHYPHHCKCRKTLLRRLAFLRHHSSIEKRRFSCGWGLTFDRYRESELYIFHLLGSTFSIEMCNLRLFDLKCKAESLLALL